MSGRARSRGAFGQASRGGRGRGSFRGNFRGTSSFRGGRGRGRGRGGQHNGPAPVREDDGTQLAERFEAIKVGDEIDEKLGFPLAQEGLRKEGWLVNMHPTLVKDVEWPGGKAAVDYYFIQDDGGMFKCTFQYEPYFYIACKVRVFTLGPASFFFSYR